MKLLIAIPALNEEKSIARIIERTLAAREHIQQSSFIKKVEVAVVSDGSTDKTVELAQTYVPQIRLIIFKKNRGYGAAIKEAWRTSDADILGFLDADGTCDPRFFAELCKEMEAQRSDIVLGCRMNAKSKMPFLRRIGNVFYALLLSTFSSTRIRDTASGMRIVKRSCLPRLMPLPDGLHFTPAMSAQAILSKEIKVVEVNMPYQEREGRSKLSIWKDGLRFLRVISEAAFLYRPGRILGFLGLASLAAGVGIMLMPIFYYLGHLRLAEWMIYRFTVGSLAGIAACLLICASHLSSKIVTLTISRHIWRERDRGILNAFFHHNLFWFIPFILLVLGSLLIFPSLLRYLETGQVHTHWSRFMTMSFLFSIAIILAVTKLIDIALDLIAARLSYLSSLQRHPH